MRKKIYVAVCGLVDSGKSSFIKGATEVISNRKINPDALCIEQETGKTITNTKISCPINDKIEIVFIDCPGHLEYYPEIISALCLADAAIFIKDEQRLKESEDYIEKITPDLLKLKVPIIGEYISHSCSQSKFSYEINDKTAFQKIIDNLLAKINVLVQDNNLIVFESWSPDKKLSFYSETGVLFDNVAWKEQRYIQQSLKSFDFLSNKEISRRILICDAENKSKILGLIILNQ